MAGPWFTVHRAGDDWKTLDTIWISNGKRNDKARVQARVRFAEPGLAADGEAPKSLFAPRTTTE